MKGWAVYAFAPPQKPKQHEEFLYSASSSLKREKTTVTQRLLAYFSKGAPGKLPLPYPKLLLLLSFLSDEEAPAPTGLKIYALILVRGRRELIICHLPPYLAVLAGCGTLILVDPRLTPTVHLFLWHAAFMCTLYTESSYFPPTTFVVQLSWQEK